MGIIIGVVLIFVLWCICDSASFSTSMREHERERKEEYEKETAAAREQYPKIKNWSEHPLFAQASVFLVENVNNYIQIAKQIPVGVTGGITFNIDVESSRIFIHAILRGNDGISFFYSDCGYDRIKVGYTNEETIEACKEFASALSIFLSEYYVSRENIKIEDAYIDRRPRGWNDCGTFSIELRNIQPKLKQI